MFVLKKFFCKNFHLPTITNPILSLMAYSADIIGVVSQSREVPVIISIASKEEHFNGLVITLYSLFNQKFRPDRIVLWLSSKYTLNDLPYEITRFLKNGLEIRFVKDIYSYTKTIYALKEFSNSIIVTAEDDIYYPKNWLKKLYYSYILNPMDIQVHSACRVDFREGKVLPYKDWQKHVKEDSSRYENFPKSVSGILYPPECFSKEVLREDIFLKYTPCADDVWLWVMALLNGRKIRVVSNPIKTFINVNLISRYLYVRKCPCQIDVQMSKLMKLYGRNILKKLNQPNK